MKIAFYVAASLIAVAAPASAQSVFDGSWKADIASAQMSDKPFVRTLKAGSYTCVSCNTPFTLKADGQFHAVKGQDYADEMSMTVDGNAVITKSRKGGKLMTVSTETVSADGATIDWQTVDTSSPSGVAVNAKGQDKRVGAAAPAGAHPMSGAWKTVNDGLAVSDSGLVIKLAVKGNVWTMETPTGQSFVATFGGPAVAMKGDVGGTTVTARRISATTIEETDHRGGKAVSVYTYTALADGKTIDVVSYNPIQKSTAKFKMTKL